MPRAAGAPVEADFERARVTGWSRRKQRGFEFRISSSERSNQPRWPWRFVDRQARGARERATPRLPRDGARQGGMLREMWPGGGMARAGKSRCNCRGTSLSFALAQPRADLPTRVPLGSLMTRAQTRAETSSQQRRRTHRRRKNPDKNRMVGRGKNWVRFTCTGRSAAGCWHCRACGASRNPGRRLWRGGWRRERRAFRARGSDKGATRT